DLLPEETLLKGKWETDRGKVREDRVCVRIKWIIKHRLKKIADSPEWGAWLTLYIDPRDGRLWERSYPEGEMQGGGPPQLRTLTEGEAAEKYKIEADRLR